MDEVEDLTTLLSCESPKWIMPCCSGGSGAVEVEKLINCEGGGGGGEGEIVEVLCGGRGSEVVKWRRDRTVEILWWKRMWRRRRRRRKF